MKLLPLEGLGGAAPDTPDSELPGRIWTSYMKEAGR